MSLDEASGGQRSHVAIVVVAAAIVSAAGLVALRLHFQPPTVPAYAAIDATGHEMGDEIVVAPGGRFHLEFRPAEHVDGAIGARAFLIRGDDVRPWDPPFSVSLDGTIRLDGAPDVLFAGVPDGPWELAVAVGRPEVLPTAPRDVLRARTHESEAAGWRLIRRRIRREGSAQ